MCGFLSSSRVMEIVPRAGFKLACIGMPVLHRSSLLKESQVYFCGYTRTRIVCVCLCMLGFFACHWQNSICDIPLQSSEYPALFTSSIISLSSPHLNLPTVAPLSSSVLCLLHCDFPPFSLPAPTFTVVIPLLMCKYQLVERGTGKGEAERGRERGTGKRGQKETGERERGWRVNMKENKRESERILKRGPL